MDDSLSLGRAPGGVPPRGTVLGFDFGTARIGVAVAELELGIAHPLETIASGSEEQRDRALERLVADWRPAFLVVGLPPARGTSGGLRVGAKAAKDEDSALPHPAVVVPDGHYVAAVQDALDEGGCHGVVPEDLPPIL